MRNIQISFDTFKAPLKRYGGLLRHLPWLLGRHAFLYLMVCFVLAICLGQFLFYNYVFLAKVRDPEAIIFPVKFNDQAYNKAVKEWQDQQVLFLNAAKENYTNPFSK